MEWILDAFDASFLCFFFLPCFASFLHLTGSSRGLNVWHLGGLLVSWVESLALAVIFIHGIELRGMLGN
jgi:hypothetical protein